MTDATSSNATCAYEHFDYFLRECQETGRVYRTIYELFIHEPEMSRSLLDKLAPCLFRQIFEVFRERLHLGIARLTDPATTGGHVNLSAQRVVQVFKQAGLAVEETEALAKKLKDFSQEKGLETLRNKHLAHLDGSVIVGGQGLPIPLVHELDRFFDLLQRFVEEASRSLSRGITEQVFLPAQNGYGEQLLDWLDTLGFADVPENSRRYRNSQRMPPFFRPARKI